MANQQPLSLHELRQLMHYLKRIRCVAVKEDEFCHCNADYLVVARLRNPVDIICQKLACPSCTPVCPECGDYTDELVEFTIEGQDAAMCVDCYDKYPDEDDDVDSMDGITIEQEVDRILSRPEPPFDPRQRLIKDFYQKENRRE
jgi:hypothetical protein